MRCGIWEEARRPTTSFAAALAERRASTWLLQWPPHAWVADRSPRLEGWHLTSGLGSIPMEHFLDHAERDPRLAWISRSCLQALSAEQAWLTVTDRRWPPQLVVEGLDAPCPLLDATAASSGADAVRLDEVSFNRMVFDVTSRQRALLAVNVPYTTGRSTSWTAAVNGRPLRIWRANAILHAIEVPRGRSRVELRYWSWPAFAGVLLSAATGAALLAYAAGALRRRSARAALRIAAAVIMAGAVALWVRRVNSGESWQTAYVWNGE
jgi:hypothetical protein